MLVRRAYHHPPPFDTKTYRFDGAEASERVLPVDVHGARPTDALPARPSKRQSRVLKKIVNSKRPKHNLRY